MANTAGQAIALNYGYNWLTGFKGPGRTLLNTGNTYLDYTRIGIWLLGEGEMDGCEELWDSGLQRLLYTSENDDPTHFHFHRGCDAVIGSGQAATSIGPDQGVDTVWNSLPPGLQPINYNRIAYYTLMLKLVNNNVIGGVQQGDPNDWADLNPVGLWRGLRCRLFDGTGQMVGYSFTTNPAWHYVDVLLRRKIFPEYNIDFVNGPDDLTTGVRNRFDWGAIVAAAQTFDTILDNGSRQFEGHYSFSTQTSLQAVISQILQCCRSYQLERNGKLSLICDQKRTSVFSFSRRNADNFSANDTDLHSAANRYVAKFRDLLIPSAADIVSISTPDHQEPTVTTLNPHPFVSQDRVVIGGTGTKFDSDWVVDQVGAPDANGDVFTLTLVSKGSNYPSVVGAGGKMGFLYSRFKDRAPEFNHHRNQFAKGSIGVDIPRQRNKVKLETDFATTTYDQANRISRYQMYRALGPDVVPYVTPVAAELEAPLFAPDEAGSGNLAIGIEPGDVITVDDTLSVPYAGLYEVLKATPQLAASSPSSGDSLQGSPLGGKVALTLGNYADDNYHPITSDPEDAGFENVPGSEPGNDSSYTLIDLADGEAAFFSGTGADQSTFSMPNAGFNPANLLAWSSAQGYIEANHQLHLIERCDVDANRKLYLTYADGMQSQSNRWHGDSNFLALTWRSRNSVAVSTIGAMTFVTLTLLGGELVCFGSGIIQDGAGFALPAGFTTAQMSAIAFVNGGQEIGDNDAHGFRAYIDVAGNLHVDYQDGENNIWHGPARVLVFAWQNNNGTAVIENGWTKFLLPSGYTFAAGCFQVPDSRLVGSVANPISTNMPTIPGGKLILPTGFTSITLQVIPGVSAFQIVDHPTHGMGNCLVDGDLNVLTDFEDGEGNIWYGISGVFGVLCDYVSTGIHLNPTGGGGHAHPGI